MPQLPNKWRALHLRPFDCFGIVGAKIEKAKSNARLARIARIGDFFLMENRTWTDTENDLLVADYFTMLQADVAGAAYNKSQHRRVLMEKIDRSKASIEYKHRNLSAVLVGFGHPWITGYAPAYNFQDSLAEAVSRFIARNGEPIFRPARSNTLAEEAPLFTGPPPTLRNDPDPQEVERLMSVAYKYDVGLRDAKQRALGHAGEQRVLLSEKAYLRQEGRSDLAEQVRWVSQEDGDGAGYDIESFSPQGTPRLVEVKTTNGWERTPFHISRNELRVANENSDSWVLFRVYNFARQAKAFELRPPLERHVALTATSFQASFTSDFQP